MSTDFRALCAELAAELDHNRRCLLDDASVTHPLADRARTALAKPADAPAAGAERPSDKELLEVWCQPWDTSEAWGALKFARAVLARWGQPPDPPAEGEVAELIERLKYAKQNGCIPSGISWGLADGSTHHKSTFITDEHGSDCGRAAELLERHAAPVPVWVSERPWERDGWCDMDGECWWCPPDGPAYWSMVNPAMVYGGWLLPHWAIHQPPSVPALPLPAPQGGEVGA